MPRKVTIEGDDIDSVIQKLAYGDQPPAAPTVQPTGPTMREVTIGGKTFLVEDAMADALEANAAAQEAQFAALRGEFETVRQQLTPPAPAAPAPADDLDTLLFTNPTAALERVAQKTKQELRQEYLVADAQKAWWAEFYGQFQHLEKSKVIVEAVMRANFRELERLPEDKQMAALAKKVEDELAPYVLDQRRRTPAGDDEGDPGRVEGGGRPSVVRGGPQGDGGDIPAQPERRTIADIFSASRKRRIDARMGRQQQSA